MRKTLTITTAVAAALLASACGQSQNDNDGFQTTQNTAVCTDGAGNRVDDDLCDDDNGSRSGGGFAFIYLGGGSHVPRHGQRVTGGSKYKSPGTSYSSTRSAAATSRGGFGSSARSSSGG